LTTSGRRLAPIEPAARDGKCTRRLPIIVSTQPSADARRLRALDPGVNDYVTLGGSQLARVRCGSDRPRRRA
jgi:hypothetical protein